MSGWSFRCCIALALQAIACGAYEITPPKRHFTPSSTYHYVDAPLGCHALMAGPLRVALFDASGHDMDIVWGRPRHRFTVFRQGAETLIKTVGSAKEPDIALSFGEGGSLKSFRREGDDGQRNRDQVALFPRSKTPFKDYWKAAAQKRPKTEYWGKGERLRLGYSNPNACGAFFMELAVLALGALLLARMRWLRMLGSVIFLASAAALFLTGSRGSFLGLAIGAVVLFAAMTARRFSWKKLGVVAFVGVACAGLLATGALGDRFGKNLFEMNESNMLRLRCWKAAPAMMAAAPSGWSGHSGHAYCDWFQDIADYHPQTWMFNGHITWMVEHGRAFRVVYCSAWLLLLLGLVACAAARLRGAVLGLAMWVAWVVALWFSTIGHCWTLWILPSLAVLPAVWSLCARFTAKRLMWTGGAIVASALIGGVGCHLLHVAGDRALAQLPLRIGHADGVTVVGYGRPKVWILKDDLVMSLGLIGTFGREVRSFLKGRPDFGAIGIVDSVDKVPMDADTVVAAGRDAARYVKRRSSEARNAAGDIRRLVLLSPALKIKGNLPERVGCKDVLFLTGGLMQSLYLRTGEPVPAWARFVPGAGPYVPGWLDIAFGGRGD